MSPVKKAYALPAGFLLSAILFLFSASNPTMQCAVFYQNVTIIQLLSV